MAGVASSMNSKASGHQMTRAAAEVAQLAKLRQMSEMQHNVSLHLCHKTCSPRRAHTPRRGGATNRMSTPLPTLSADAERRLSRGMHRALHHRDRRQRRRVATLGSRRSHALRRPSPRPPPTRADPRPTTVTTTVIQSIVRMTDARPAASAAEMAPSSNTGFAPWRSR